MLQNLQFSHTFLYLLLWQLAAIFVHKTNGLHTLDLRPVPVKHLAHDGKQTKIFKPLIKLISKTCSTACSSLPKYPCRMQQTRTIDFSASFNLLLRGPLYAVPATLQWMFDVCWLPIDYLERWASRPLGEDLHDNEIKSFHWELRAAVCRSWKKNDLLLLLWHISLLVPAHYQATPSLKPTGEHSAHLFASGIWVLTSRRGLRGFWWGLFFWHDAARRPGKQTRVRYRRCSCEERCEKRFVKQWSFSWICSSKYYSKNWVQICPLMEEAKKCRNFSKGPGLISSNENRSRI